MYVGCLHVPNGSGVAWYQSIPTRGEGQEMTGKHAYSTQPAVSSIALQLQYQNDLGLIQALVDVLLDTAGQQ